MHIKIKTLIISTLITGLIAMPDFANAYYDDPYEAFFSSTSPRCGTIEPSGSGRLLSPAESCALVIRGSKSLSGKLHYWVTFRPVGHISERRISPIYTYKNKLKNNSEFLKFSMKGTGEYYVYFDDNNNAYPDAVNPLGYFYKNNSGEN